jgi:hypothetical protein
LNGAYEIRGFVALIIYVELPAALCPRESYFLPWWRKEDFGNAVKSIICRGFAARQSFQAGPEGNSVPDVSAKPVLNGFACPAQNVSDPVT